MCLFELFYKTEVFGFFLTNTWFVTEKNVKFRNE